MGIKMSARLVLPLILAAFSATAAAAEKRPETKNSIDVYEYWPWRKGLAWTGSEIKNGLLKRTHTMISLGPSEEAEIRVLWEDNWTDYYKETEKGLERPRDFNSRENTYGIYTPPAIQYPHYTRIGEIYRRTSLRSNYSSGNDKLMSSYNEDMTYVALGFEDVTVPAGTFKDCLMQLRDYKAIRTDGSEHRKIVVSWNAKGIGLVRVCVSEFKGGKMENSFCAEGVKYEAGK